MSNGTFVNYWISENTAPPWKALNEMPEGVDVAPLAFQGIDDQWQLDFGGLTKYQSAGEVQGWIKELQARGTKVLFSINDTKLGQVPDVEAFAASVAADAVAWGVDGVDLDYEPADLEPSQTLLDVTAALRTALCDALGTEPLLTAPVWGPWQGQAEFLGKFAAELDFVTTMDYTPWPGFDATIQNFAIYAQAVGGPEKVAIGVSCMGPPGPEPTADFTPIDEVKQVCAWEPDVGKKRGVMLYTFPYDVETRPGSGTGYPDGTFTETILAGLA
jgi:hypothetical protein